MQKRRDLNDLSLRLVCKRISDEIEVATIAIGGKTILEIKATI